MNPESASGRQGWPPWAGPCLILLAAAIVAVPAWFHGVVGADDCEFHLISWLDAQHSWLHGIPYPHWAVSPNFGAGEPRFVFYPPLTWMLGALVGLVLPWTWVPAAMIFLLLAGTGLATRAFARLQLADAPTRCSRPTIARPSESLPAASGFRWCCCSFCAIATRKPEFGLGRWMARPCRWPWQWRGAGSPTRR